MTQFVLTPEQATFVSSNIGKIPVYSPNGVVAGYLSPVPGFQAVTPEQCPFSAEEIAAAERAAENCTTWHTTEEVLARLKALPRP